MRLGSLFNLEVDVLFIDTTSTYFEIEGEDPDAEDEDDAAESESEGEGEDDAGMGTDGAIELDAEAERARRGLRKRSRQSKDSRPDLAQVVIGFAVTRDGIPVRCWVWPGNAVDATVISEVKRDLNEWKIGRVVAVLDSCQGPASFPRLGVSHLPAVDGVHRLWGWARTRYLST